MKGKANIFKTVTFAPVFAWEIEANVVTIIWPWNRGDDASHFVHSQANFASVDVSRLSSSLVHTRFRVRVDEFCTLVYWLGLHVLDISRLKQVSVGK